MNLVISLDHRFDRTPDGSVWTRAAFSRSFYSQYLSVFEGVRVVARVRDVVSVPADARRADGDGVSFHPVPYYIGPKQFVLRSFQVMRAARKAVVPEDAVILRVGSRIATIIEPVLRRARRPYGLEVVMDPFEIFAPGCMDHPLRPLFRVLFHRQLQRQCARAPATAYVTQRSLQRRYAPAPAAFSVSYSDVEMPVQAYVKTPRPDPVAEGPINIITVGSLEQLYKGSDVLIKAVQAGVAGGLNLRLVLIGDGKYRSRLEMQARVLGDRVRFLGQVASGACVREYLDAADLFILPSRTEGLPRALVEAMARALPCIGSAVGGIPELLAESDLVPPGDSEALAGKIGEVVRTTSRMAAMSARNLAKSQEYQDELLQKRRDLFYRHLRQQTEAWLHGTSLRTGHPQCVK